MSISTHFFSYGGGGGGVVLDPITLTNDFWFYGASSMQGHFLPVGNGSPENVISNTVRSIWQPALTLPDTSYTTDSGSKTVPPLNYTLNGTNTGRRLRNRGAAGLLSGTGASTIDNFLSTETGLWGASDFMVLHQGDNGVSATALDSLTRLSDGYASMRSRIGARNFLSITNTQAGSGSTGGSAGEPAGGSRGLLNNISTRVQNDLNPGKAVSFYETTMDNLDLYNLTLTAGDLTDISQGLPPRSGMMNDGSHAIGPVSNLIADVLFTPLVDALSGGARFPVRQVVESVAPSSPAASDAVGTIVAYGSGGSLGLATGNTQTDYVVASSGDVTRIGATLPAKDITWAQVSGTKANKRTLTQRMVGIAERAPVGVSKLVEFNGSVMLGQAVSRLANGPVITILMRLQHHFTSGTDQLRVCGGGGNWTVTLRNTGVVEVRFKNADILPTSVNVLSADVTGAIFSPAAAPQGRWLAISIDYSDPTPANRKNQVVSWVDPAGTVFSNTTLLSGTNQPGNAGTTVCNVDRASGWNIGIGQNSSKTNEWSRFRMGDFTYFTGFIDFTVLANRQEISNSDGTPKTAWVTSGGVTAGVTPYMHLSGNASDFRLCRFTGTGAPASPGAVGEYWGAGVRNISFGNPGFLATV